MSRSFEVENRLRPAMRALRDAEDWARLELCDEVLATRIRGIHESLSDDVLNGVVYRHSDRWKARLWDRYCLWRGHDGNAGAGAQVMRLRRLRAEPYLLGAAGGSEGGG